MEKYKLAYQTIDKKDYRNMSSFLKKGKHLTQSKITKKFEKNFTLYQDKVNKKPNKFNKERLKSQIFKIYLQVISMR